MKCYKDTIKAGENKMKKRLLIIFLVSVTCGAFADGAGGVFFGYQTSTYPFLSDNYEIPNSGFGLNYFGGYGYGVSRDGVITGGFGMAITDPENESGITGGFGGVINGYQLIDWPIQLNILAFIGFGGLYTGNHQSNPDSGYFGLLAEVQLELGVPVTPWLMPSIYIGYQAAANVVPGEAFKSFISYTPTIGVRIAWGSFGRSRWKRNRDND
jgi:hypothetical protein